MSAPSNMPAIPGVSLDVPDEQENWLARLGFERHVRGELVWIVPPLVPVPAGDFAMGSSRRHDHELYDDELPRHWQTLPAFQIGRFPVTVAEYACFVRDGGDIPQRPRYRHLSGGIIDWQTQRQRPAHPVVCVTWYDACAYAEWLAHLTRQPWRLPSEAAWEKAARWDPIARRARIYPWGDGFDTTRCNTREGGIGDATVVGLYPQGASPFGAEEMAGNVVEWTSTLRRPYPYDADDGREQHEAVGGARVLRGGSWFNGARGARSACRRQILAACGSGACIGFRLMLAGASS